MNPDDPEQVRSGYSGQGGPLTPLSFSTRGEDTSPEVQRANRILNQMDRLNLYRIAAQKAPFAMPIKDSFRFTSGFGMRWGRMHNGHRFRRPAWHADLCHRRWGRHHAGWLSGYGRLVKIQHEFGIETRYAHLSKIRVKGPKGLARGEDR